MNWLNTRKLALTVPIVLIILLSFNIDQGSADSNWLEKPKLSVSSLDSIVGGATGTLNPANSTVDLETQTRVSLFLSRVVGIDSFSLNNFRTGISFITSALPDSPKCKTTISAMVNCKELSGRSIIIDLVEGRVLSYDGSSMRRLDSNLSVDNCLAIARGAISSYEDAFNASYCEGFADIVPNHLESGNATLTNDNISLKIQTEIYQQSQQWRSVSFRWFKKFEGVTENALRVDATVSRDGLLTSFIDYMAFFQVASNVTITREKAIEIAKPYIDEYAMANNRIITGTSATLHFGNDINNSRDGDGSLLFPEWYVSAGFLSTNLNVFGYDSIVGYDVLLWGDNGNVSHAGAIGVLGVPNNASFNPVYFIAATGIIIITVTVLYALYQRKKCPPKEAI